MNDVMDKHQTVLLNEAVEALAIKPKGFYIDATFGRGGHSQLILNKLNKTGKLLAIDVDPDAVTAAQQVLKDDPRFKIIHAPFSHLYQITDEQGWVGKVNGILLDLGVSSPQLEQAQRGFSFMQEGPLDMRMDPTTGLDAATWLVKASEREIAQVLKSYGEERYARRIARLIKQHSPIKTTQELVEIVKQAKPVWEKTKHPATRTFLAIRVFINKELCELEKVLQAGLEVLSMGGRIVVISFHSLEDRLVKKFLRFHSKGDIYPKSLPIQEKQLKKSIRIIGSAIRPSETEKTINPRSRSAILRIGEKIQ